MKDVCNAFYIKTLLGNTLTDLTIYVDCRGFITEVRLGKESLVGGCRVHDLTSGKLITFPGFIDIHVHLRDFELSYKEDLASGSSAAVSSGYTLVCDMPNTRPYIDNVEMVRRRVELARKHSYVDYGVYCGIPHNEKDLNELLTHRNLYVGFKIYPEDIGSKYDLIKYLLNRYDGLVLVHAELPDYVLRDSMHDLSLRYIDRPSWNELTVMKMLYSINGRAKLHLTHSTHPTSPHYCRQFNITVDTTPAYFTLSSDEVVDCWRKVNPPIPDPVTRSLILHNIFNGLYDAVVSDHAPHSPYEKCLDWRVCPSGLAMIEVASKVLITFFTKGVLGHELLLKYLCSGPARILGIEDVYGHLSKGYRASFTVIDISKEGIIRLKYSKAGKSGFEGLRYRGEVIKTIVGGEVVYDSGEVILKPNTLVVNDLTNIVKG